jgi:hypothetical protein
VEEERGVVGFPQRREGAKIKSWRYSEIVSILCGLNFFTSKLICENQPNQRYQRSHKNHLPSIQIPKNLLKFSSNPAMHLLWTKNNRLFSAGYFCRIVGLVYILTKTIFMPLIHQTGLIFFKNPFTLFLSGFIVQYPAESRKKTKPIPG